MDEKAIPPSNKLLIVFDKLKVGQNLINNN